MAPLEWKELMEVSLDEVENDAQLSDQLYEGLNEVYTFKLLLHIELI